MPEHWQETTLGGVATVVTERVDPSALSNAVYVGLEHLETGSRTLSTWGSSSDVSSSTTPFMEGDTLFGRLRPYLRKGCVAPFAGVCTPEILVVRGEASIDPRFLGLLVLNDAVFGECDRLSAGSRMPRTSAADLKGLSVLVPPVEEQRRIVDLVGSIDTYIDSLETQIDATRTARSALLSELLSNPGDDWQETTLGDVADWFAGGTPKATNSAFYTDGQIPWAVIADLLNDPVVETAKQINEDGLDAIGGRVAPVGSILVSMYGTIARTAIAGVPLATNQAIAWAEPHSDACDGGFLRLLVDRLQPAFESAARGAAQKNINRGMIKDAGVLLPPLAEQRRILDLIGSIDEQISSLESQVESVRALRSGVLSELLSGERLLDESYDVAVRL